MLYILFVTFKLDFFFIDEAPTILYGDIVLYYYTELLVLLYLSSLSNLSYLSVYYSIDDS
jgi:hypothetical protein